jgi:hypothetical protein
MAFVSVYEIFDGDERTGRPKSRPECDDRWIDQSRAFVNFILFSHELKTSAASSAMTMMRVNETKRNEIEMK